MVRVGLIEKVTVKKDLKKVRRGLSDNQGKSISDRKTADVKALGTAGLAFGKPV